MDHTEILVTNQAFRRDRHGCRPGRDPEEVIDGRGTHRGFQGASHVVDVVSGADSDDARPRVIAADGGDGLIIPADDRDPIGLGGEAWRVVRWVCDRVPDGA
jgi:hypothetical protein